jgi:hypothetical protein
MISLLHEQKSVAVSWWIKSNRKMRRHGERRAARWFGDSSPLWPSQSGGRQTKKQVAVEKPVWYMTSQDDVSVSGWQTDDISAVGTIKVLLEIGLFTNVHIMIHSPPAVLVLFSRLSSSDNGNALYYWYRVNKITSCPQSHSLLYCIRDNMVRFSLQ